MTSPPEEAASPLSDTNRPSRGGLRNLYLLGLVGWSIVFGWLWVDVPPIEKLLGGAWFAVGLFGPVPFLFSLALALPWFGNNPGGPHHLYLLDMALMGLVIGDLAGRLRGVIQPRRRALDPWIVLFVIFSWFCLFPTHQWIWCELVFEHIHFMQRVFAIHDQTSFIYGITGVLRLTLAAGLYFALRDRPWPAARLMTLWWVLLACLAFSAVLGLLDYLEVISLKWWRGVNPDIDFRFGHRRLQSLYRHSGWYAQVLAALAPGALALALAGRGRGVRWTGWGLTALFGLAQLLTLQRGGWIALAAGLAVVAAAAVLPRVAGNRRSLAPLAGRIVLLVAAAAALVTVLALVNEPLRQRLGEMFRAQHRTDIWRAAGGMISIFPLTGAGLGHYYRTFETLFPPGHPFSNLYFSFRGTAHSLYFHIWAERGLIGLLLFLPILGGALIASFRAVRRAGDDSPERPLALATCGGLTVLAVYGLFQYIHHIRTIDLVFWCLVAWSASLGGTERPPLDRRWITRGGGVALMAMAAVVVLWEHRNQFEQWSTYLDGENYLFGPAEARLKIPEGADRVRLRLTSWDPNQRKYPVIYTISLGGAELAKETFDDFERRAVVLDLPPGRPPGLPLIVRASHTWSPWAHNLKQYPLLENGVLYLPLEKVGPDE